MKNNVMLFTVLFLGSASIFAQALKINDVDADGFVLVDQVQSKINKITLTEREYGVSSKVEGYVEGIRRDAGSPSPFSFGLTEMAALEESGKLYRVEIPEEQAMAFLQEQKAREGFSGKADADFDQWLIDNKGFTLVELGRHVRMRLKASRTLMTLEPPTAFVSEDKVRQRFSENELRTPDRFLVEYAENGDGDDDDIADADRDWKQLGDGPLKLEKIAPGVREVVLNLEEGGKSLLAEVDGDSVSIRLVEKLSGEEQSLEHRYDEIKQQLRLEDSVAKVEKVKERVLRSAVIKEFNDVQLV